MKYYNAVDTTNVLLHMFGIFTHVITNEFNTFWFALLQT
jgi:uncharacterized protein YbgA (DUF1722 family)